MSQTIMHNHDFDLVSSRVIDAAPDTVWSVFADPKQLARWWGPKGFTDTIHAFDFRIGGAWRHTLHGSDGKDYDNAAAFVELDPPRRIVFEHNSGKLFTLSFAPAPGGKTLFSLGMTFDSAATREAARALISVANEENIDRLVTLLRSLK